MGKAVKFLIVMSIIAFSLVVLFAPLISTPNGVVHPGQTAGYFPRYESLSCRILHVGLSVGLFELLGHERWQTALVCSS